jgi:hypothetical protein
VQRCGDLNVVATTAKNHSFINEDKERTIGGDGYSSDPNFSSSAGFSVVNAYENGVAATVTYVSPATAADQGSLTTITFAAGEDPFGAPDSKDCVFAGTALSRLL